MNYLNNLENNLNEVCADCFNNKQGKCEKLKCNIGFSKYITKNIRSNDIKVIEDGNKLIPNDDTRYYDEQIIAKGIGNICRLCKECNENHNENCVISLMRKSLERTQLKEDTVYPGNILSYLMEVSKQNVEFANSIGDEYKNLN